MGYSFRLKMKNPSWREVLARLQPKMPPDLRVQVEQPDKNSKKKTPTVIVLFREKLSTRGAELLEGDDTLTLRIPAFPTREDVTLGLQVTQLAAQELEAGVETIDGKVSSDELFTERIAEPLARAQSGDAAALNALISRGETQELPGAVRPFFIGPRLYGELRALAERAGVFEAVTQAFHVTQWAHLRGHHAATVIGLRKDNRDFTASAWAPGQGHLFTPVDLILVKARGQPLRLPWAGLKSAADGRWRMLDEKQILVDAYTLAEWPEVVARAEGLLGARN